MENAEVTKTLLCFMVKSLCCKYEDVVAMVPLPAINSSVIKKCFTTCCRCSSKLANLELLEDDEEGSSKKEEFLQLLNRCGL
ncbi:Putative LOC100568865, partial [Caligus rogercresseyi]